MVTVLTIVFPERLNEFELDFDLDLDPDCVRDFALEDDLALFLVL